MVLSIPEFPHDSVSVAALTRSLARLPSIRLCLDPPCSPTRGDRVVLGPVEPFGPDRALVSLSAPTAAPGKLGLAPGRLPQAWIETLRLALPTTPTRSFHGGCGGPSSPPPVALLLARDAAGRWKPQQMSVVVRLCK